MRFLRLLVASIVLAAATPASAQLWLWSQTPTTNAGIDPSINWQEGMPPSAINDSSRAEMAIIAKWRDDIAGLAITSGGPTVYALATQSGNNGGLNSSLVAGYRTCFTVNVTNGTPATLAIDSQVSKPLRPAPGAAIASSFLTVGVPYCVTYATSNGGEYILNGIYPSAGVAPGSITYSLIQNVVNNNVVLGNILGANHTLQELTGTQVTALLNTFSSSLNGLVPSSGGGTSNFLRADGQWVAPPGGGPGGTSGQIEWNNAGSLAGFTMSGDATLVTSTGVITIAAAAVTYSKIQLETAFTILGNANPTSPGTKISPEEILVGAGLTLITTPSPTILIPNNGIVTSMITNANVTYAKIQNETNATILGNDSGGAAAPGELTLGAGLSFLTSTSVGIGTGALTSGMYATGSVNTAALASASVTYAKIQNVTNARLLGNDSGGAAAPSEISLGFGLTFPTTTSLGVSQIAPNIQTFTSGTSLTYTTPTSGGVLPNYLHVRMVGAGGGGGAATTNAGNTGSASGFAGWTANGGTGGPSGSANTAGGAGGTGGSSNTGTLIARFTGEAGQGSTTNGGAAITVPGGAGGLTPFGGAGQGVPAGAGGAGATNTGSGGAGGSQSAGQAGGGGGAGEYVEFIITSPASSYGYTVGAVGTGGAAGVNAGGNGAAGYIIVEAFWF
jgi:hypothetical protein